MIRITAVAVLIVLQLFKHLSASETEATDPDHGERYITAYKVGLKLKLQEQLLAVKQIDKFNPDTKTKFLNTSLLNIFSVFVSKRASLEKEEDIFANITGLLSDSNQLKEDVSLILENAALLGNLALRHPDSIHSLLSRLDRAHVHSENSTLRWAVQFAERFGLALFNNSLDKLNTELPVFKLMKQELNLVERDPNYSNPFSLRNVQERQAEEARLQRQREEEQRKKEKRLKRGPKLSGVTRTPVDSKRRVKTEL